VSVTRSVSGFVGARISRVSFQARLTLVATVAVAAVLTVAAAIIYFTVQAVLIAQIDDSLNEIAINSHVNVEAKPDGTFEAHILIPPEPFGGSGGYYQVLTANGQRLLPINSNETTFLPVSQADRDVVAGRLDHTTDDAVIDHVHLHIYTKQISDEFTLQAARQMTETDQTLASFRFILLVVSAGGVVMAALLGRLVAQAGLLPIHRLRQAVDHVTETGDMSQRIPYSGPDELGLLGSHFNRMLGGLDQSLRTQRQLVADASHELRTPLASLRTNIEVLQRSPDLVGPERDRLLRDVVSQVEQLTRLIQDLIDLARGDQTPEEKEEVRLDWVVATAVDRAATNWPAIHFETELAESVIVGQSNRLDRAVSNLLDNAGKWSLPGSVVEVRVTDHEVTVRDHGPGIDRADLPFVFDRFWRAPAARSMPGSGLGLSIVRQVAESHGGSVTAELPPDGGTLMRFKLPDRPVS
jgi:two-component system sensor histidine kinase MprB